METHHVEGSNSKPKDFLQGFSKLESRTPEIIDYEGSALHNLNDLSLSPETEDRLRVLLDAAEALAIEDVSFSSFSQALLCLTSRRLSLKQSLHNAEFIETELRRHVAELEHEEKLLSNWKHQLSSSNATSPSDSTTSHLELTETAESMSRRRQALLRKAREYQSQLEDLQRSDIRPKDTKSISISDLTKQQESIRLREQAIKKKRARVGVFEGLPANLELARIQLRQARDDQMRLIQLREGLLANMVDGVS